MWASRKSTIDCGRCTSARSGSAGSTKPPAGSWIIWAAPPAAQAGTTRESVTDQLITNCYLSSELFTPPGSKTRSWRGSRAPVEPDEQGYAEGQGAKERQRDEPRPLHGTERLAGKEIAKKEGGHQ